MDFGTCFYRSAISSFSLACDERGKYESDANAGPVVRFDLTCGLSAREVDERIGRGRRAGDIGHRTVAFYLAECAERRLHQTFGHSSVVPYAQRRHGLSRRTVRDLIATGRALQELRKIDAAFIDDELPWSKVRAIAKVADVEHEDQWLEFAKAHPVDEVDKEASLAKKGQGPRDNRKGTPPARFKLQLWVSELVNEHAVLARKKLGGELGYEPTDEDFAGALIEAYLRKPAEGAGQTSDSLYRVVVDYRVADGTASIRSEDGSIPVGAAETAAVVCDAGVTDHEGKPVPGHAPPVPDHIRRHILARDGFRCLVCASPIFPIVHHIVFREHGGQNVFSNLMTLCTKCHTLVHDGGLLSITGEAPHRLEYRDRTGALVTEPAKLVRQDGPRLEIGAPSGPAGPLEARGSAGFADAAPSAVQLGRTDAAPVPMVDFDRMPSDLPEGWFERHEHLITPDPRQNGFRIEAGYAMEAPAEQVLRRPAEQPIQVVADACAEDVPSGPAGPLNSGFAAEKRDPLRPDTFAEVVGQTAAVASLRLAVEAARASGHMPDHVLLSGRPGLGKTTLAAAFARELGGRLRVIDVGTLDNPLALIGHLVSARNGDVIFLDEIHGLSPRLAELLYGALEDRTVLMRFSDGVRSKAVRLPIANVTFIGATTNPGRLPEPLVARFPLCEELEPYGEDDLATIVRQAARRDGMTVADEAAAILARASGRCARTAINLYRSLRRILRAQGVTTATPELAHAALEAARVDERGLGPVHRRILDVLAEHRGPMAVRRLARAAGLTLESFRTLYEPVLFELRAIRPTPRGIGLGPR